MRTILLAVALPCVFAVPARAQLTVGAPQTVSETRTSRTIFEYTMQAVIANSDTITAKGVTAICTSSSPTTTVVQGTVNFGNIGAGLSATSVNTFTIAHDRTVPFDPAVLQWTLTKVPAAPAVNSPTSPTKATSATLSGTSEPGTTVEIVGGASTVAAATSGAGAFSIEVPMQVNRINKLFVTAFNAVGRSEPVPVDITHDAVAPSVFIDFPADRAQLTNDSIAVAGRVGDMLSGFMGLNVTVNGLPANVAVGLGQNGTFDRANVALAMGANTISAIATDVNGNTVSKSITVTRVPIIGPRLEMISGDGQTARVHEMLAAPIVVKMTHPDGTPFAGKVVTFNVTRSDGRLSAAGQTGSPGLMAQVTSDALGLASVQWTLGGDAGCGNNRISVTSKDISGTIFFCASALASPPSQINIGSGNNQRAEAGGLAPEPLRAWVSDSCNGIVGVPVTFSVTNGGGKVNGLDTVTVDTANTGHASVQLTLGPNAGANTVTANFPDNKGLPVTFTTYGLVRDVEKPTTFTGLVLDNTSQPIGGAFCGITVDGSFFTATTDMQGRFTFGSAATPLPAGKADFYVNGTTATSLGGVSIPAGSFPSLSFTPTIVPNAENSLTSPVLLPRLNPANARNYDGTTDLILTCQGIAGLKMTIKAGSMRKLDGSLVSPTNPAVVSLNQVSADSVPMPIPDGASPPFTWTLQPSQCTFDPPIQIEYPNMSGLPVGSIANFLTYNHDTEKFEIFASGSVTRDGSTILSDPGAGLTVSGWGGSCPPYTVTSDAEGQCEETSAFLTRSDSGADARDSCQRPGIHFVRTGSGVPRSVGHLEISTFVSTQSLGESNGDDDSDNFKLQVVDPNADDEETELLAQLEALKPNGISFAPPRMMPVSLRRIGTTKTFRSGWLRLVVHPFEDVAQGVSDQTFLVTTDPTDDSVEILGQIVRASWNGVQKDIVVGDAVKRVDLKVHILSDLPTSGSQPTWVLDPTRAKAIIQENLRLIYAQANIAPGQITVSSIEPVHNLISISPPQGAAAEGNGNIRMTIESNRAGEGVATWIVNYPTRFGFTPKGTAEELAAMINSLAPQSPGLSGDFLVAEVFENPPFDGTPNRSADILLRDPRGGRISIPSSFSTDTSQKVTAPLVSGLPGRVWQTGFARFGSVFERALLRNYRTDTSGIDVFVVNEDFRREPLTVGGVPTFDGAVAYAKRLRVADPLGETPPLQRNTFFVQPAVVGAFDLDFTSTVCHELGHLLLDAGHAIGDPTQLMNDGAGAPQIDVNGGLRFRASSVEFDAVGGGGRREINQILRLRASPLLR